MNNLKKTNRQVKMKKENRKTKTKNGEKESS